MSELYVNTIHPRTGDEIAVSGNLNVSGTFKAYQFETIVHNSTTYQGDTIFGNNATDHHQFNGNVSGSGYALFVGNIDTAGNLLVSGSVGIGQSTPTAKLEVEQGSTGGSTAFKVDNDDTDQIAMSIEAANIDADVVDITADAVTTANVIDITADALTTGTALNIATTATNDSAGSLVKIAQAASRAGSAASIGLHIDFDTVANANARAFKIESEQTTGVVAEIDGDAVTTGTVLEVVGDALTTGTGLLVSTDATNDAAGALVKIVQDGSRAGSAASVGLDIDFDTVANANARALRIDSEQTTGVVAEVDASAITTGTAVSVNVGTTRTTGAGLVITDTGTGDNAGNLVKIHQDGSRAGSAASVGLLVDFDTVANANARAFKIESAQTTGVVAEIDGDAITTGKVVEIIGDGLTTGNAMTVSDGSSNTGTRNTALVVQDHASAIAATALKVQSDGGITGVDLDKNFAGTSAATVTGLNIDLDKTAATTSNNTIYGVNIDLDNTTATNGTNTMVGVQVTPTLTHAADAGVPTVKGAIITATGGTNGTAVATGMELTTTGADTNNGLIINCADGGTDLKLVSSADTGDYFSIATTAAGATTITTVDDGGAAANLTFTIDGDIIFNPAGGDILPNGDAATNLGSSSKRWANVYTADLHLKNDRGDWTIVEEEDYLSVVNNNTGKIYKIMMEEIKD